jgi:hypothetical protein
MPRPATGSTSPDALDLAPGIPPWEHQPGETAEAYERFRAYLDVDPLVRSKNRMAVVYDILVTRDPHMCSVAALQNMASLNHWHLRAAAWDKHRRQLAEQAAERAEQEWAETLARRRAEARLKHLEAADELIRKGLHALAVKDEGDLTGAEARGLVELGYRIERETLLLAKPPGGQGHETGHVHDLDDEQTAARLKQLADELARRMNPAHSAASTAAAAPDVLDAEVIPEPRDSSDDEPPLDGPGFPGRRAIEAG